MDIKSLIIIILFIVLPFLLLILILFGLFSNLSEQFSNSISFSPGDSSDGPNLLIVVLLAIIIIGVVLLVALRTKKS